LVMLISGPLWGGFADATRKHRLLLLEAILGTEAAVIGLGQASAFAWLVPLVILYAFFISPVSPLIDHSVLQLLGERKDLYGSQRMWGAVSWGIAAPLMGWLIQRSGLMWIFLVYPVLLFLCLLSVWRLPVSRANSSAGFWHNLRKMRSNRSWLIFLAAVLLAGAAQSLITNFLFLYLKRLGADASLMGLSQTVSTLSEIPFWLFSGWMLARWKPQGLLAVSLLLFAVRLILYGLVHAPWLVLVIQLLHGPTFSILVVAGVSYASEIAPPGMGATAQTIFSSVTMGLGAMFGALVGGALFDRTPGGTMFLLSGIVLLALLIPLTQLVVRSGQRVSQTIRPK